MGIGRINIGRRRKNFIELTMEESLAERRKDADDTTPGPWIQCGKFLKQVFELEGTVTSLGRDTFPLSLEWKPASMKNN